MKLSKKLLSLLVTATLVVGTSITAFAATNSDVITALKNAGADSNTITAATNYLNSHSVDAATAVNDINNLSAKYPSVKSAADYNNLSASDKQAFATDAKAVASDLGLTLTKNSDGSLTVKDSTGAVVETIGTTGTVTAGPNYSGQTGTAGNTTATNYGTILAVGAALAFAGAAGTAVVAKKKDVAANN